MDDSPAVSLLVAEVADAIRRAYAEGHRRGTLEAVEKMTLAVGSNLSAGQDIKRAASLDGQQPKSHPLVDGAISNEFRQFNYGKVITTVRQALAVSESIGISKSQIMNFCFRLGVDVTPNQFRDTMKRLVGGVEVVRQGGLYFPGAKLRKDLIPAENLRSFMTIRKDMEASDVEPEGAPSEASHDSPREPGAALRPVEPVPGGGT